MTSAKLAIMGFSGTMKLLTIGHNSGKDINPMNQPSDDRIDIDQRIDENSSCTSSFDAIRKVDEPD